jgi:hypothetical protein
VVASTVPWATELLKPRVRVFSRRGAFGVPWLREVSMAGWPPVAAEQQLFPRRATRSGSLTKVGSFEAWSNLPQIRLERSHSGVWRTGGREAEPDIARERGNGRRPTRVAGCHGTWQLWCHRVPA